MLDKQSYMHTPMRPGTRFHARARTHIQTINTYCLSIAKIRERVSVLLYAYIACIFYIKVYCISDISKKFRTEIIKLNL
jgi:hypothetical protein